MKNNRFAFTFLVLVLIVGLFISWKAALATLLLFVAVVPTVIVIVGLTHGFDGSGPIL